MPTNSPINLWRSSTDEPAHGGPQQCFLGVPQSPTHRTVSFFVGRPPPCYFIPSSFIPSLSIANSDEMCNHCASCGKADANLKACKACMMVKYCSVECQVAHRPAHKKACREKAKELFDEKLYAEPPKKEECPICMIPLPCNPTESMYMPCCGKLICNGCRCCLTRNCCPFCNTTLPIINEEEIKQLTERIEKYNDPEAMTMLGDCYRIGQLGLLPDQSKAFELFQRASELGSAAGQKNLGTAYYTGGGVEIDIKKAVHHWQISAMMGNMSAVHNLGCIEEWNGNFQRAMRHFMIAAKGGYKDSLGNIQQGFKDGHVTKEDFEKSLRDYQASCDETRSEQRDRAAVITRRLQTPH